MALQLQYTRGLDDRARALRSGDAELEDILGGDTRLSDESLALGRDERRASVLEPGSPAKSYTGGQEPDVGAPVAGGGLMESPGMELMRMREREEQMRRTQEQLLGAPAAPPTAPGAPAAPVPLPPGEGVARAPAEVPEEEEAAPGKSALQLAAEQQMENLKQQAIAKAKEKLKAEVKKRLERQLQRRATSTTARLTIEGAEVATSETVIPIILFILELNIQMINKYIFTPLLFRGRGDALEDWTQGAPLLDQSFLEDVLTVFIDISLTMNATCCNPCCFPIVLLVIIVGAIAITAGDVVDGIKAHLPGE